MIDELAILQQWLPILNIGSDVAVGPGDDCAVIDSSDTEWQWLQTVDQLVDEIHFNSSDTPPEVAGIKLLKRNISDIAAMGGTPKWALLTIGANNFSSEWILEFLKGVKTAADQYGISIIGGDISSLVFPGLVTTLALTGIVPRQQAVLRSGAKAGDRLWVTGKIGNSFNSRWHLDFIPRLKEGNFLRGRATAMLDISDGLLLDAARLAKMSNVDLVIDDANIPLRTGAILPNALSDGEDYELLFSAPATALRDWPVDFAPITAIGEVIQGSGNVRNRYGDIWKMRYGYEH